jgi:RNA polymerase sigma factor (sigma-70 family)
MDTSVERLYKRYHPLLVRFVTRMTRCPHRAEDVAQAAWVKLLGARRRGVCASDDESELRAYLFTVARNAVLDEYTRHHGVVRTSTVDPCRLEALLREAGGGGRGPEQEVASSQVNALLQDAVDRLPDGQRKVVLMWCEGASIREMASACQAPQDTVLSRKKYAIARLRRSIGHQAHAMA